MAAMCDNGEFFRPKMKAAFLIAPVARVINMTSPMAQKLKDSDAAFEAFKAMGPEIMTEPTTEDIFDQWKGTFTEDLVNSVAQETSDGCPDCISKIGKANANKFYPAGSCFQQIHHFH